MWPPIDTTLQVWVDLGVMVIKMYSLNIQNWSLIIIRCSLMSYSEHFIFSGVFCARGIQSACSKPHWQCGGDIKEISRTSIKKRKKNKLWVIFLYNLRILANNNFLVQLTKSLPVQFCVDTWQLTVLQETPKNCIFSLGSFFFLLLQTNVFESRLNVCIGCH